MRSLLNILDGKKTYLIALIALVLNIGVHQNWWTVDQMNSINAILAAFGLAALRAGVAKSA